MTRAAGDRRRLLKGMGYRGREDSRIMTSAPRARDGRPVLSLARQVAWLVVALGSLVSPLRGQDVTLTAITAARECQVLLPLGDRIYGGLSDGGVIVWDPADPARSVRWTVREGLSGQRVTALAAGTGHLWVATNGAGLTRVTLGDDAPDFRQFVNIGGLDVTAVAATTQGVAEVVYYGLRDAGLGVINSGLPGPLYTQAEHGLVSDNVTALVFHRGSLWIGTDAGVSRFSNNVFTTETSGLTDLGIQTLASAGDTLLLAGTSGDGVARWDEAGGAWAKVGNLDGLILSLAVRDDGIWALRQGTSISDRLFRWTGAAWESITLAEPRTFALGAGDDALWAAGGRVEPDMDALFRASFAFLARYADATWTTWRTSELAFLGVNGVGFAGDGAAWLGSREGVGLSRLDADGVLAQVLVKASADNDSTGLLHFGAPILSLAATPDGDVWCAQFEKGLIQLRPGTAADLSDASCLLLTAENSPLSNNRIVRVIRHPDGPLLFCSDTDGVDVLVDPARPRDPTAWIRLPTDTDGLTGGTVRAACFWRRDVAWFAVVGAGLVSWDLNGAAGPNETLTWTDPLDDTWSQPQASVPDLSDTEAFTEIRGMVPEPGGDLWAGGGSGLYLLRPTATTLTLVAAWSQKSSVFLDGLLSLPVRDLEIDANGDLWVAQDAGLNRVRRRAEGTTIDAYTDIANFDVYEFGDLYGPGVLAALPGGSVRMLDADPNSRRLVAGSDYGAVLIDVAPLAMNDDEALAGLYLYPNPFRGGEGDGNLRLGGITADVRQTGGLLTGGATVEVRNLEGQILHRASHVADNEAFWDGTNLEGNAVAGGLYVVKVSLDGRTTVRTLAVVR